MCGDAKTDELHTTQTSGSLSFLKHVVDSVRATRAETEFGGRCGVCVCVCVCL